MNCLNMLLNLVSNGLGHITLSYYKRSLTEKWVTRELRPTSDCDNVHESLETAWVDVAEVSVLLERLLLLWSATLLSQLHLSQVCLVLKHVLRAMT